jgi:hypothetical protein
MNVKTKKTGTKRHLRLFFNELARKSAAESLKKASWMSTAAAAYVGWTYQSVWYLVAIAVAWLILQIGAHLILSLEERRGQRKLSEPRSR